MKKNTSILFLSIFALAMSVFGFMGIQPVKATTTLGEGESAIEIVDGAINFEGADISYASESTKVFETSSGTITLATSGNGKLKFYSSYSQELIEETLAGKTYITGTLIARLEDVTSYNEIIASNQKAINVVTYNQAQGVNFLTLGKRDEDVESEAAYWTMVSLKEIPRVNYGVKMLARPYVAVDFNGDGNYQYAYATCEDVESYAFSLASTVKEQIANGYYNDPDKSTEDNQILTAEGREIRDTYTKFNIKVYFDPSRVDDTVWDGYELETETIDETTYYVTTVTYNYGDVVNAREIYEGTPFEFPGDTNDYSKYSTVLGFYNRSGKVIIDGRNLTFGKASNYDNYVEGNYLTQVYGDMTIFEKVGPANLLDNFSDEISERASFTYSRVEDGVYDDKPYLKRYYAYMQQHEGAKYVDEKEDNYGVKEQGVLIIPSQLADTRGSQYNRNFYFKSSIRNTEFFDSANADYDYVAFRLMILTDRVVSTVRLGVGGGIADTSFYDFAGVEGQSYINAPVNQWITVKLSRYYFEDKIGSKRMGALNIVETPSATANFYVREGSRRLSHDDYTLAENTYNVEKFEGEYQLCIDYMAYEKEMGLTANGQGYEMEEVVLDDGRYTGVDEDSNEYKYEKFARYSTVTANAGEVVTLATLFDEYTVKYTVIAPNGEVTVLEGNTFVPTQVGTYKVIATCDDYYLKDGEQTTLYKSHQQGELTLEVVGKQVSATIENANAKRGDIVTLSEVITDVKYGDDVVDSNVSYLVKAPSEEEYTQLAEFVAKEEGVYSIKVQYNYNGYLAQTEALELTVAGRQVSATLKEDVNAKLGDEITVADIVDVTVDGLVITDDITYFVNDQLISKFFATEEVYSIKVQYVLNEVEFTSEPIELTVGSRSLVATVKAEDDSELDLSAVAKGTTVKLGAELEDIGVVNATYFVKSPSEEGYTECNSNTFVVTEEGVYSVKVEFNYNGVDFVGTIEFTGYQKQIVVTAEFVDGEGNAIDFNEITFNKTITIKVFADGEEVTQGITYSVIKLDKGSNDEVNYDYQFEVTDGTFTAVLAGNYEIYVEYAGFVSQVYEITVNANSIENARVLNTFSDSTSVAASYLASDKATMVEGTTWYREYNGANGVISTTGQTYNTSYSAFYLMSADYNSLTQLENAGFLKTVYNVKDADGNYIDPDPEGYLVGFNSENWDYLSIKAYFAKPEGVTSNTLNVNYADNSAKGDIITVNYNEWVELRLDKGIVLKSLTTSGRLLQQYAKGSNAEGHRKPMFYADSANVGTVYFDSMSFEKYTEYKHFAEFYYEDAGVQVPKDAVYTFAYSTSPRTLAIKIKLEEKDEGCLTIPTVKSGANIGETTANIVVHYYDYTSGLTRTLQDATGAKVSYSSSHQFYADKSKYNVPAALQVSATAASKSSTVCLKYIYTHTDGTKYVGYLAFKGTTTA